MYILFVSMLALAAAFGLGAYLLLTNMSDPKKNLFTGALALGLLFLGFVICSLFVNVQPPWMMNGWHYGPMMMFPGWWMFTVSALFVLGFGALGVLAAFLMREK